MHILAVEIYTSYNVSNIVNIAILSSDYREYGVTTSFL